MDVNSVDNWDDDWENIEIPDLIVNLQDTIKNRERELKLLEERKMMEDAELVLAEDLFNKNQDKKQCKKIVIDDLEPVKFIKKDKPKEIKILQEKKRQELQEKQKEQSQKRKAKKMEVQRLKDIYGEADLDEYDERYGNIEDKYY